MGTLLKSEQPLWPFFFSFLFFFFCLKESWYMFLLGVFFASLYKNVDATRNLAVMFTSVSLHLEQDLIDSMHSTITDCINERIVNEPIGILIHEKSSKP